MAACCAWHLVCIALAMCGLAAEAAADGAGGAEACGAACTKEGCKSMAQEMRQGGEWEDLIAQEFHAPSTSAQKSMLEIGSGEGLAGLWFLSRANASTLTSVERRRG